MPERRRDETAATLAAYATVTPTNNARFTREITKRGLPGLIVGLADLTPHPFVVGERVQQADALRAREDKVVARDRREPLRLIPPLTTFDVKRAHGDRPLPHR